MGYSTFWGLGGAFAISLQTTLFIPFYSEQNISFQVPPASKTTTLPHFVPSPSYKNEGDTILYP